MSRWSRVYTPADFYDTSGDNGKWPSWQEMVRRGKNLIIVTERNKHSLPHFPHPDNRWFFEVTTTRPAVIPEPADDERSCDPLKTPIAPNYLG